MRRRRRRKNPSGHHPVLGALVGWMAGGLVGGVAYWATRQPQSRDATPLGEAGANPLGLALAGLCQLGGAVIGYEVGK